MCIRDSGKTNVVEVPAAALPEFNGECDYSTADQNNGWGWNPTTQTSCPPIDGETIVIEIPMINGECDYSAASLNGGYGWNPTAQLSCPPIVVSVDEDNNVSMAPSASEQTSMSPMQDAPTPSATASPEEPVTAPATPSPTAEQTSNAVSYTHLTLPTICSV